MNYKVGQYVTDSMDIVYKILTISEEGWLECSSREKPTRCYYHSEVEPYDPKFGELFREDQLKLFDAWLDGETIEYKSKDRWLETSFPRWYFSKIYRVKPELKYKAFGYLSPEEKKDLMGKWVDGETIESSSEGESWDRVNNPAWFYEYFYRVKP